MEEPKRRAKIVVALLVGAVLGVVLGFAAGARARLGPPAKLLAAPNSSLRVLRSSAPSR